MFCRYIPFRNFHWLEELFSGGFKFHGRLERKMEGCPPKDCKGSPVQDTVEKSRKARCKAGWEMDLSRPRDAGLLIARQDWCELNRPKSCHAPQKSARNFSKGGLFQARHVSRETVEYQIIGTARHRVAFWRSKSLFAWTTTLWP